ncbi:hypothetical protein D3OALGA1CA_757 [Olavius algarvensis associated proteobacterium Delta 3]|nr:hypothetical protein D3OALGA1CA_757 [Olavius algarvensis associated proteobacterium Delta 3]CAB5152940.1 hypothetical protein D3OALGB2SA_4913 [Olavius algarvensis associated proteobacterium Delta 3]
MDPTGAPKAVNQKIFNLGLSVETISLYLLCCGMAGTGIAITRQRLREKWNSSDNALARSLGELESMSILQPESPGMDDATAYILTEDEIWTTG